MKSTKNTSKADSIVQAILSSFSRKDQISVLPRIINALQKHLDRLNSQGEIVSAIPLSKEYMQEMENILETKMGEKVYLKNTVDPNILGGVIIRFKDMVIDQSLKHSLSKIKEQIYES